MDNSLTVSPSTPIPQNFIMVLPLFLSAQLLMRTRITNAIKYLNLLLIKFFKKETLKIILNKPFF